MKSKSFLREMLQNDMICIKFIANDMICIKFIGGQLEGV